MRHVTLALLVVSFSTVAAAQAPFTDVKMQLDSPAAKRAKELFDVVEAGDPARSRAFVSSAFMPGTDEERDQRLLAIDRLHRRSGDLTFVAFRTYDPPRPPQTAVLVYRSELLGTYEAFVVEVESAAPFRLTQMQVAPARPPKDLPPEPVVTQAQMLADLAAHVDELAAADVFSGTVLVAKDGKVVYQRAAGEAERSFHAKNTMDTRFNLGSMNKMFTAIAIAQLVEQGRIGWNDPISKWLGPDWLAKEHADRIQVHHLLDHSSGLGSYFNDAFLRSSRALYRNVDDWKPLVKDETPAFEPGSRFAYSNTGFLLLGAIVEKASGEDYYDYVRRHVYAPAAMTRTDCYALDRPVENLAVGYTPAPPSPDSDGVAWRNNLYEHVVKGGPAGGGFSTAPDLLAFAKALLAGKLVKKETMAELWSPHPGDHVTDYGFGFDLTAPAGQRIVGHSGGFPGINSQLDVYPDTGWVVVVMSNTDDGASIVTARTRNLIARLKPAA